MSDTNKSFSFTQGGQMENILGLLIYPTCFCINITYKFLQQVVGAYIILNKLVRILWTKITKKTDFTPAKSIENTTFREYNIFIYKFCVIYKVGENGF
jgi:hypothetical protein